MSKAEDYIRDRLIELSDKPFGSWGKKESSNYLSRLFVTTALPELGHVDASDYFEEGYVDGSGDLGIDVIIKVAKEVHIIQAKYVAFNKKLERDGLDTFQTILARLSERSFDSWQNGRLTELLEDIEWDKDNVFLWFVTNVRFENQAKAAAEMTYELPAKMVDNWGLTADRVQCEYIDQDRLYETLMEVQSGEDHSGVGHVDIYAAKQAGKGRSDIIILEENDFTSVIMVIDSEQIAKYCRGSSKNALFDFNIRNYLGENKKNKKILDTARDKPENFFLCNNGISAICEHLEVDEVAGRLQADRFSVINGAQTVRSLSKLPGGGRQPRVLIRVTEIPHHKVRRDLLREIVRCNNTQNEIKSSDFRSNDAIQASFKAHFSTLTKDGKKCEYFSKRTDVTQKATLTHKIEMTSFAKAVFCYFYNPYELQAQGSGILFDQGTDNYERIFGPEDSSISKDDFLVKAGAYFAWECLDDWVKKQKASLKDQTDDVSNNIKNALERKTVLIWMLHHFLQRLERETNGEFAERSFLIKFSHLKNFDIETGTSQPITFLRESLKAVKDFVVYQYQQRIGQGVTQRQWIRGLGGVKDNLEHSIRTFPNLTAKVERYVGKVE